MRPELTQAVELLRSGNPGAIDDALALLQNTVFSFSMKVCGHREDAEDTMQDVLLKALPYLPKLQDPQALAVWLYKVARNRCWMSRRRSKFAPRETVALDDLMPDASELESLTAGSQPSPEALVASHESAQRVREAVLSIPAPYRLVLVLHDMEDLDTPEVARVTGLKEGTVRVRLHRARLLLRRELSAGKAQPRLRRGRGRAAKPVPCRKLFAQLSEYLDGRLPDLTCERIQKHLQDCPPCVAFLADLQRAVHRCRAYAEPCRPETAGLLRKLLADEYLRVLKSQAAAGQGHRPSHPAASPAESQRGQPERRRRPANPQTA
jgi:RNA polymerase sigma-70 factor (ECF subfamily)